MEQPTNKSRGRSGDKTDAMRQSIVIAASHEFRRKGFHQTRMVDIAESAEMAVGNLYYYFRNKQDLLLFCQQRTLDALFDAANAILERPEPADHKLHRLICAHLHVLNDAFPVAIAHMALEDLEPEARRLISARRKDYEKLWYRLLGEGIGQGLFRPVNVKLTALALLGAVNWTVRWYEPGGPTDTRSLGHSFAELLVRGILEPGFKFTVPEDA